MTAAGTREPVSPQGFPKSARLLKSREFFLRPCERYQSEHFRFFFTRQGKGRLGVSLSKKVLRQSVARNRVRRLLREVFRQQRNHLGAIDLHLVAREGLRQDWRLLDRAQIEREFHRWEAASAIENS